jgi:peptide/nickel transport system substrate-binding protein
VSNRANGIDLIDGSTGSIAKSSITQNENYGIHLSEATGNSIIENEITENKAGAIYAKSSRVTISQNDVLGNEEGGINSNGIVLASGSTGIVSGNLITRNGGCGIGLSEITDCSVKGNEITENRCHGIYANKAAASISENRIADNIGIGICGISSALQITGNEIRANRRGGEGLPARGIDLKSSTADIVANRISDHKEAGIYLKDVSKSTVQGNETVHNGCGIAVFGSQVDITNNRISEGQTNVTEGWYGYGVQLTDGSEAIILDNQISENTGAGILCVASVAEIINNHITDTIPFSDGRFGRAINVQGGSTVTIEQNRILGSAAEGISSDGSTIRIHQNYLIGNGSHGAEVIAFDSPVSISGNTILFNRGDGLVIDIESLKAELEISVTGNLVADNLCGLLDNGVRDLEPFLEANVVLNNEQQQYVKVTPREPELKLQEAFQSSSPLLETLSVLKEESAQLSSGAEMAAAESFWAPMQLLQGMLGDVYRDNGYIEEAIVRYNAAIDLDYRPSITWDARIKKARAEMTPKIVGSPLILEFPSSDDLDATQQFLTARGRPASFNPYVLTSLTTPLVELMHAGLTKTNPVTEDVEAAVAERWEISDDFTCYTFHLRNLCFSDGERLTAEDVLFTFKDVILNEQVNIVNDYGPDRFRIGDESVIERLETVDERTVRFILKQPFAPLLRMLDVPILPKHLLEAKVDANSFKEAWSLECPPSEIAGLGPFRLVEADRQNKEVYEKNPFYWKRDERGNWLPYATKLTVAYIDQPYQELLSGKIDFLTLGYNDMKDLVGRAERLGIQVISGGPQFAFYFFALNQDVETRDGGLKEIFRDRRFRRAISHAIDRQGIANTWFAGYATPQYGPIYQSSPFYVEDALLKYDFNLELVAGLLDEIGLVDVDADGIRELPDGSELEFEIMTHWSLRSLCSDIIENLEQIGIRAELRGADTSEISAALRASPPTYEAILSGWWGTTLDPTSDMMIFQSTGSFHFYRPSDARGDTRPEYQKRIDQLLHMQTTETDESQRKRLLEEFQQKFTENQDVIFIVSPLHLGAAQEGVANYANPNLVSEIGPLEVLFRKARLESPGG